MDILFPGGEFNTKGSDGVSVVTCLLAELCQPRGQGSSWLLQGHGPRLQGNTLLPSGENVFYTSAPRCPLTGKAILGGLIVFWMVLVVHAED